MTVRVTLWRSINVQIDSGHNVDFPFVQDLYKRNPQRKSILLIEVLNFLNKPLFEGMPTDYTSGPQMD